MWCYFRDRTKCYQERCITCPTYREYHREKALAEDYYLEAQMEGRRLEELEAKRTGQSIGKS